VIYIVNLQVMPALVLQTENLNHIWGLVNLSDLARVDLDIAQHNFWPDVEVCVCWVYAGWLS
jgi:hypothetical protein